MSLVVAVMEDGQILDSKPLDDYVLICGEGHELTYTQKHSNGTTVLTVKVKRISSAAIPVAVVADALGGTE